MKKTTILLFVVIALAAGYLIGNRTTIFVNKSAPPYTYNFQIPKELSGESTAFSGVVKVVSPVVVNISTSKIVERDTNPLSDLFDDQFFDFMEPHHKPKKWKERSLGSGVIVSPDGYILTNTHVVEKADEIMVTLSDQQNFKGKIIGSDPKTDIAVIKISTQDLPTIKWGNSDKIQVGEFVLAFGNPYSLSNTVTMGIVSAVGRANVGIADYEDFIQTDAAINPGNSGGPLVNIKGELIGINTAIFSRTGGYQGIGFAVPSNMAQSVMSQLINKGKVTRGWLGITIQNFTPELAKEFGLNKSTGALVTEILKGSPAEKAGIKRGDIITEVDGKAVKNVETLRNIIAQSKVGSRIQLKVIRDGNPNLFTVTITELPQDISQNVPGEPDEKLPAEENALAGFSVMNLTQEIAKQLDISKDEKGVVIVRVEPYSAAEEAGLKKGDVIQEINKKSIKNSQDFNYIISKVRKGDTLLLFINRGGNRFYITLKVYS